MIVVSAYYNIPSKQPNEFYYEHIQRFFQNIKPQIVFFTDNENYQILKDLAGSNVQFQIQEFHELEIFKQFPAEFWQEQIKIDPEKYHTWQLGAIWANKSRFVQTAMNIVQSEWYMWIDAGSLRKEWPEIEKFGTRPLPETPGVYLQLLKPINKSFFSFPDTYTAGSHILFHKEHVNTFVDSYSGMINIYEKEKISLISDQYIINSMLASNISFLHPILVNIQTPNNWFFFYSIF